LQGGRLARCFRDLRAAGNHALIAYVTAGDPGLDATRRLVLALLRSGADVIELGVPFSDPLMDGPVIQAASQRALEHGTRVSEIFEMAHGLRQETDAPIILMTCYNPVRKMGLETFAGRARSASLDGVLVTDLPPDEGEEWIAAASACELDRIFMLGPTSSPERVEMVARASTGFIYCQSRAGVTGERTSVPQDLGAFVGRVRAQSELPIAVGFGISTPEHVRLVCRVADGAIVGSAFVRIVGECGSDVDEAVRRASQLAAALKRGTEGSI
jgi:tryptophan synthase alpha chain